MDDLILWADKAAHLLAAILRNQGHDEIVAARSLIDEWDAKFENITWEKLNELGITETHNWRDGASDEHHREPKSRDRGEDRGGSRNRQCQPVRLTPLQNTGRQRSLF